MTQYGNQVARQLEDIRVNLDRTITPIWSRVSSIAQTAFKAFQDAYPPNWPEGVELDLMKLEQISEYEGIPIFYVPRAEIVTDLLGATSINDRFSILEEKALDIGQDCLEALSVPVIPELQDRAILATKSAEALIGGYHEAAQALAVVVCDSYLKTYLKGAYTKMQKKLSVNKSEEVFMWPALRFVLPMAAAVPFLVPWDPGKPDPAPGTFSRHATIHGASTQQINPLHSTIAVMLATTMTRALDAGISKYGSVDEAFNGLSSP